MESPDAEAPVVELPERVDRRVRLGPFSSARDAVKFVCYAAVGAVLAPLVSPFAWVPVLVLGFAVSVWRSEGEAVDERAARWLLFQLHRRAGRPLMSRGPLPTVRGSTARLSDGRRVAVVRTGGVPLAYRPPADLVSLFERFRELLRASEGPFVLRSTTVALREGLVIPAAAAASDADLAARAGYRELVTVLCRRRRARRVEISLSTLDPTLAGEGRLSDRTQSLVEQLASLGLRPIALQDRGLAESVHSFGWTLAGPSP